MVVWEKTLNAFWFPKATFILDQICFAKRRKNWTGHSINYICCSLVSIHADNPSGSMPALTDTSNKVSH